MPDDRWKEDAADVWRQMREEADRAEEMPLMAIVTHVYGDGDIGVRVLMAGWLGEAEAEAIMADILGQLRSRRIGRRILRLADDMPPKDGEGRAV